MDTNKGYSINDVARMMNMSLKIVRRYVASGELKTSKINNAYNISEDDFEAFRNYIDQGGDEVRNQEIVDSFSAMKKYESKNKGNSRNIMYGNLEMMSIGWISMNTGTILGSLT